MMQNISFQGRTNLIFSNVKFDHINNLSSTQNRRCSKADNVFISGKTFGVETDTMPIIVFIRNAKEGFIKRITNGKKTDQILYDLEEQIEFLKRSSKEKLTAWIIGGKSNCDHTTRTINEIADVLCDRPDIDASILAGDRFNAPEKIFIRGTMDHSELIFPELKGLKSTEDFEKVFDIVELNNTQISI